MAGLFLSLYMRTARLDTTWYRARAVAESVKTISWRFSMRAEPFGHELAMNAAKSALQARLQSILSEHKDLAIDLGGSLAQQDQITSAMIELRERALGDRVSYYRTNRIDEQRSWYAKRSVDHRSYGHNWFVFFVALQAIAISFVLLRIAYPELKYWPATAVAAAATAALTWSQTKRYRELSAAYGLTAHEIGLAKSDFDNCTSDSEFSRAVVDTENAFSREHTQWIARKA